MARGGGAGWEEGTTITVKWQYSYLPTYQMKHCTPHNLTHPLTHTSHPTLHPHSPHTHTLTPIHCTCAQEKSRIFRCALRAWSSVSGGQSSLLARVQSMSSTLLAIMPSLSSSARRRMNSRSSSRCFFIAPTQLRCGGGQQEGRGRRVGQQEGAV